MRRAASICDRWSIASERNSLKSSRFSSRLRFCTTSSVLFGAAAFAAVVAPAAGAAALAVDLKTGMGWPILTEATATGSQSTIAAARQRGVVERQGIIEPFSSCVRIACNGARSWDSAAGKLGELAQQAVRRDQTFVAPDLREHGLGSKAFDRVLERGNVSKGMGMSVGIMVSSKFDYFRNTLCQID